MLQTRFLPVIIVTLLLAVSAAAKDGRDFAGFYSLSNAAEQDDQVRVTVTLQLFNYSGEDLTHAAVSLREAPPGAATLGTYAPIESWPNGAEVKFTLHISVPRDEYARWGGRRQPVVIVENRGQQGREWQRTAQVSRRPMIPLEDNSVSQ